MSRILLPCLACAIVIAGCDSDTPAPVTGPAEVQLNQEQKKQLSQSTRAAWTLAEPAIEQLLEAAIQLSDAVSLFLEAPSEATLQQAQARWLDTLARYQPLHLYSTMADYAPQSFELLREVQFALAARPIEPGYLDSVGEYAYSGLVHDISLPLSAATLREQHGRTQEADASLGLFAMEFMLFGEPDRPRQIADYQPRHQLTTAEREQGYSSVEELPQNRRRQLLLTQAQLLTEDLHRLQILWQPRPADSFYRSFVSLPSPERRQLLLRAVLLELKRTPPQLPAREDVTVSDSADEPGKVAAETNSADTAASARPVPAAVLRSRLQYIHQVLEILQVAENLRQQVKRAADAIEAKPEELGGAREALQRAVDLLTEALQAPFGAGGSRRGAAETLSPPG